MSENHGKFGWYDVMTSDVEAAKTFYSRVVGWDIKDSGMVGQSYMILSMGTAMVGGLMAIPEAARAMGARPAWMGYIMVDDVDSYATRVKAAGGAVQRPPEDIPGVGRFSVVTDPHGAAFILFKGTGEAPVDAPQAPGHIGWRELHAGNLDQAFAFYSGLFGWTKAEAHDMGPMGLYQIFAVGGKMAGGMMTKTAATPTPFWLYYFNVDAIDAAAQRVKDAGGQVVSGPMEVPGGAWIVQCFDPQGAMFAMLAPKR